MVPSMQSNTLAQLIADINGKGSQEKWIFEKAKETKLGLLGSGALQWLSINHFPGAL